MGNEMGQTGGPYFPYIFFILPAYFPQHVSASQILPAYFQQNLPRRQVLFSHASVRSATPETAPLAMLVSTDSPQHNRGCAEEGTVGVRQIPSLCRGESVFSIQRRADSFSSSIQRRESLFHTEERVSLCYM